MLPANMSPHKTVLKTFFDSNVIKNHKNHQNQTQQCTNKQKSISFCGSFTPSYLKTPKENLNYINIQQEKKRSLTPRFQLKNPTFIKNQLLRGRQQSSQQKSNLQSMTARKNSEIYLKKIDKQQNKPQTQLHTKRQYLQNRIKKFQSLRSTINSPHSNLLNKRNSIQKNANNQQQKKLLAANQTTRGKFFTVHCDAIKQNEKLDFRVEQKNKLNYSPSDRSLDKIHPFIMGNRFSTFNSKANQPLSKKPYISQPFFRKDLETHQMKNSNEDLIQTKKENKIPSFLNAKTLKKNQNNYSFKPKQFPRFFPSNLTGQKQKQQQKMVQNKALSTNKHAKSFSVFQTFDFCKKDNFKNEQFSSTGQSFHPMKKVKQNQQKCLIISSSFQNRKKIGSHSLRQSLTKPVKILKQSSSIQRLNFDKKHGASEILPVTFLPLNNPNKSLDSFKKTMHNSKVVNDNQLQNSRKLSEQNIRTKSNITEKKSIIDDIKQTLIGCDLFSQQDYQNVIDNHKNDILKPQNYKNNNGTTTVNFKIDLDPQKRTSIKDFMDLPEEQNDDRFSSDQQKKLAQLAQMCQQKRSKWILQQTDTIKQSLKQLSQFNTQKSLYDNQWKKISIKDFSTARNNRIGSHYFRQIDQVREEEPNSSLKQSEVSSIKVISENCIDQNNAESTINKSVKFMKNKNKTVKVASFEDFKQLQNDSDAINKLSLQDFQILQSTQEPIFLNKSTNIEKTFISYRAVHKATNFIYTIKKFEKKALKNEGQQFIIKFVQNLRLQYFTLDNPNIQKLYAIFHDRYSIYFVCEFTENRLSQILSEENNDKFNQLAQACSIRCENLIKNQKSKAILFKQIIDGLQEIHLHRIIHKNIHPNSIRILFDTCKISGFTQAQEIDQPISQICNEYICPQSLFDSSKLAMDIWCLGILAYQFNIGRKPFTEQSQNVTKRAKKILQCSFDIPLQKVSLCEEFFNSALKRNPKERASIFELKTIWARRLKQNNLNIKILQPLEIQFRNCFQG